MSKVRFLLSTGITRFHRYYEPLRSPRQPSLALARCRLVPIFRFHCWGFPCSVCLPIHACRRHYPDRPNGPKSLVFFRQLRPSPCFGRVGICIDCFEACSAFTHVTTCMFTEPLNGPLHRRLQRLRYLHRRFDCYQVERSSSWVGLSPTEKHRLITAHQNSSLVQAQFVPCIGARNESTAKRLTDAFRASNWSKVRSLYRNDSPDDSCWCSGPGWWLSTN
jgi:hypothetical protein